MTIRAARPLITTRIPHIGVQRGDLFPIDGYPTATPDVSEALSLVNFSIGWDGAVLVHDKTKETSHKWYSAYQPQTSPTESP